MNLVQIAPDLPAFRFEVFRGLSVGVLVSTRNGESVLPPWNSLNFSVKRGDTSQNVRTNLNRFAKACGFNRGDFVMARQVRGSKIQPVTESNRGQRIEEVDGLITDVTGLPLLTLYADCVPVVVYDPNKHVLGVCHAGWQGTTLQISRKLIQCLTDSYGIDPGDCRCGIGPSIGPESYEIGPDVLAIVRRELPNADSLLRPARRNGHAYFDLWKANQDQLVAAGVPASQTEICGMDTAQLTDVFFSHRAEKGRCGLFGMVCWLRVSHKGKGPRE